MGGGQLTLNLASPNEYELFLLNAVVLSLALIPILLSVSREPDNSAPEPLSLRRLYNISPLGTVGILATGMTQGALFSMGAVFARGYGLSIAEVSIYMFAVITGGALLQWPIGRLSDRIDRRKVITGTGLAVAVVAAVAVPVAAFSDTGLIVTGILFGGTVLPMYSLYLAYVNDHLAPSQMVAASARLYMAAAVGATAGPPLTGWLMDLSGPDGFLWYFVAVHLIMAGYAFYRMTRSESPGVADQIPYAPVPGRTGELAESWVEEVTETAKADRTPG
jgi:MFS family permease